MKKLATYLIAFLSFIFLPYCLFAQVWTELGTGLNALKSNGQIISITQDVFGNIYAAGDFTDSILYHGNPYVAKWNGFKWEELGGGNNKLNADGWIACLATDANGYVYAAGSFTNTNGKQYVAKWDGNKWSELGTNTSTLNANNGIDCIIIDNSGNIYASGIFTDSSTSMGGHQYVAKWDGVSWSELGSGNNKLNANGTIWTLCTNNNGILYAGGFFKNISGNQYIAKWDGSNWTELGTGNSSLNANGLIRSIITDKYDNVYTIGGLTDSNGNEYIAKWDGSSWSELGTGNNSIAANSSILAMAMDINENIYAGGSFTDSISNLYGERYIAKWDGNTWSKLGAGFANDDPNQLIESIYAGINNNIYIGGTLLDANNFGYISEYSPYCKSISSGTNLDSTDIGRFIIGTDTFGSVYSHLANPAAMNSYSSNPLFVRLSVDSSYHIQEAGIMNTLHDADAKVTLFIDYNANGHYDIPEERVWTSYSKAFYYYILDTDIVIPSTVVVDTPLGMRLIINNDTGASAASDSACGTYISGETQDYVVIFRNGLEGIRTSPGLSKGEVRVWPNPAENKLSISIVGQATNNLSVVKIFDLVGREVYNNTINGNRLNIDVSTWSNGMYIGRLSGAGGEMVTKFVVNH